RPGSGPMSDKLEAAIGKVPAGVQTWVACSKGQYSYEFEDGEVNNGLFQQALHETLEKGVPGTIQRPDDLLPLKTLVDLVNQGIKGGRDTENRAGVSRVIGAPPAEGAAYDPSAPPPPVVAVAAPPPPRGGAANLAQVRAILNDINIPPVKITHEAVGLK